MVHVPYLFDLCVLGFSAAGNGVLYWLVKRHVDDRVTSLHEELADLFGKFDGWETRLHDDYNLTILQAKDMLSGMDRRICTVCKRLHTRYEITANGAVCEGCKGKQ